MTKNLNTVSEAVRRPKYSFPKLESFLTKSQKHRYERRKVRAILHWGNWLLQEATGY